METARALAPPVALLAVAVSAPLAAGADLLLTTGETVEAPLVEFSYDARQPAGAPFRVGDAPAPLVRWGAPAAASGGAAIVVADGSVLATDRSWSASGYVRVDDAEVQIRRRQGWVAAPRGEAVAALLGPAADRPWDLLDPARGGEDALRTVDGDRLEGRVVEATRSGVRLASAAAEEPIEAPLDRVDAIRFSADRAPAIPCCLVGLVDGSLLRASRVEIEGEEATIVAPSGLEVRAAPDDVVFLQPLGGSAGYLSDRAADDFRHTPYFDLPRPHRRDRLMDGAPLVAGGRRHAKGLTLWSASRLVYRLDGAEQRFRGAAAIADRADAAGSVVFRVYLVRGGEVRPAWESPVVRSGDAPLPIDVDATGAAAIVLVVDYADAADAGDEAVWIDARLEPPPG